MREVPTHSLRCWEMSVALTLPSWSFLAISWASTAHACSSLRSTLTRRLVNAPKSDQTPGSSEALTILKQSYRWANRSTGFLARMSAQSWINWWPPKKPWNQRSWRVSATLRCAVGKIVRCASGTKPLTNLKDTSTFATLSEPRKSSHWCYGCSWPRNSSFCSNTTASSLSSLVHLTQIRMISQRKRMLLFQRWSCNSSKRALSKRPRRRSLR